MFRIAKLKHASCEHFKVETLGDVYALYKIPSYKKKYKFFQRTVNAMHQCI